MPGVSATITVRQMAVVGPAGTTTELHGEVTGYEGFDDPNLFVWQEPDCSYSHPMSYWRYLEGTDKIWAFRKDFKIPKEGTWPCDLDYIRVRLQKFLDWVTCSAEGTSIVTIQPVGFTIEPCDSMAGPTIMFTMPEEIPPAPCETSQ